MSVADDANENIIIVSQIKKNDRLRNKVFVGECFSATAVVLTSWEEHRDHEQLPIDQEIWQNHERFKRWKRAYDYRESNTEKRKVSEEGVKIAFRWLMPLGLHGYNLQIAEKIIEITWTNTDRSRNMTEPWMCQTMKTRTWLSWVQKNDRLRKEVCVGGRILSG